MRSARRRSTARSAGPACGRSSPSAPLRSCSACPASAELILVRGVGDPDLLPRHEQRLARAVRAAYDLPEDGEVEPVAEAWRPYRAWVALLLRAWLEAETGEIARGRR